MLRYRKMLFGAVPLFIGISLWLHIMLPAEGDKGWLLHAAASWLNGNSLYGGITEINPPLIIWFYALPVLLSRHLPLIADYQALAVLGISGCILSIWTGTCVIRRHPGFTGRVSERIRFAGLLALIFIFFTPEAYFFDREHIFIVMAFPYILRFMPSLSGRRFPLRLRARVGCMAAFGFCIKPHTLLIFACLQLFIGLRARSFRILMNMENYIIAVAGIIYLAAIGIFTPDYIRIVVPMAYATYDAFRNPGSEYMYLPPACVAAALMFAPFRAADKTPYHADIYYLLGLLLACLLYAEINNGWGYSYHPLYSALTLLAGWMLWEYNWLREDRAALGRSRRRFLWGMRGCFLVLLMNALYMLFYLFILGNRLDAIRAPCASDPSCLKDNPFEQYFVDHQVQSFGTVTFDFSRWVELTRLSGARWDNRFNHLWMLPKLLIEGPGYTARHHAIVEYAGKGLAEDFNRKNPDVVLVDASPGMRGYDIKFDLIQLLGSVPEFKEAWSHYRYTVRFDNCPTKGRASIAPSECRYDLYSRLPDAGMK